MILTSLGECFATLRNIIDVDRKENWRQDRTLSHTKLDCKNIRP